MKIDPKVVVVVLNYNGLRHLNDCFKSLECQTYSNYEVVMVDNGSRDGSVAFMSNNYPWVKILENEQNLGFSEGNNVGIRYSIKKKADFIAFINNDTEADRSWLKELVLVAESEKRIGACASKLLMFYSRTVLNGVGGCQLPFGHAWDRGLGEKDYGQYDTIEDVFCASAGAMLVKTEVLKKVGLFDPLHFMTFEDTDLSWRIWLFGYRIVAVPSAIVYHKFGATTGRKNYYKIFHAEKNRIRNLLKNYNRNSLLKILPKMILHNLWRIQALVRSKDNDSKRILPVFLRAYLWNLGHLRDTLRLRVKIQLERVVPDHQIIKIMNLHSDSFPSFIPLYDIIDLEHYQKSKSQTDAIVMGVNDLHSLGPGWSNLNEGGISKKNFRLTSSEAYFYLFCSDIQKKVLTISLLGLPIPVVGTVFVNNKKIGTIQSPQDHELESNFRAVLSDTLLKKKYIEGRITVKIPWDPYKNKRLSYFASYKKKFGFKITKIYLDFLPIQVEYNVLK